MDKKRELKAEEIDQVYGGYDVNIWDVDVKLKAEVPEGFNNNKQPFEPGSRMSERWLNNN